MTLTAWEAVADGRERVAYALARPPGHHAAADSFAGYCYLNNAAIAAQAWTDRGARVAIVDVDYHHGNGTQQIFYDRDDVLFVSLHADPAFEYPFFLGFANEDGRGAGEGCTPQLPAAGRHRLERATNRRCRTRSRAVRAFAPDAIVVSLGVDTALEDADTFRLVADDYPRLGAALAALDRPTLVVQEGGYCLDVHRPQRRRRAARTRLARTPPEILPTVGRETCSMRPFRGEQLGAKRAPRPFRCQQLGAKRGYSLSDSVRIVNWGVRTISPGSRIGPHS